MEQATTPDITSAVWERLRKVAYRLPDRLGLPECYSKFTIDKLSASQLKKVQRAVAGMYVVGVRYAWRHSTHFALDDAFFSSQ